MTTRLNHCPLWMPALLLVFCCNGLSHADFISRYTFDVENSEDDLEAQYKDSAAILNGAYAGSSPSTFTTNSKVGPGALILNGDDTILIGGAAAVFASDFATNGFTIAAWVNLDNGLTGISRIFSSQSGTDGFGVGFDHTTGELLASTYGIQDYRQAAVLNAGEYYHIAYRFGVDGGTIGTVEFFVNGLSVGLFDGANNGINLPELGNYSIGSKGFDGEHFSGLVDDLRIYNQQLSNASIEALATVAIPEPGSMAVLAVGIGLGLLRRRRRS